LPNRPHVPVWILLIFLLSCGALGQDFPPVIHPNQEVQVEALPSVVAASRRKSDVMAASVATAVFDPQVCCDRDSALGDRVESANGRSLMVLGEKLRGRHYLGSGLPIVVTDQYWPGAAVHAEDIISSLKAQRPLLLVWNGQLYVVYGAVFNEYRYWDSGMNMQIIVKLLLVDTRFSDRRRYVSFDRQTDDWSKVSELLALNIRR